MFICWASLVVQMVKNQSEMWETWVWFLGWEDPLEEGMATHSSNLAWRIPMDRVAWWAKSMRSQRVEHNWPTKQRVYVNSSNFCFLRFFFDVDHFYEVFIEFLTVLLLFCVLVFWLWNTDVSVTVSRFCLGQLQVVGLLDAVQQHGTFTDL